MVWTMEATGSLLGAVLLSSDIGRPGAAAHAADAAVLPCQLWIHCTSAAGRDAEEHPAAW